ncbi:hypothetical protein [Planomonospora parontospora]|uniref:hypothetical protein n=1 Tax=Planomonospora parontospora TaxID=58119 RepID=UPI00166FEEC4|nr:hypothetical protein [Planomonospora parontospora]GGL48287.1 hypothetical protein GCM10014719_56970 [Planomonospora parontospora subsp. antibiotica]GII18761.1 hypothetical protein Ppa05_54870 [Planomonospora parontospora subsp. antibiotica]
MTDNTSNTGTPELAAWEHDLLFGQGLVPEATDADRARWVQQQQEQARARQLAQNPEWAVLHETPTGEVVDLSEVWAPIRKRHHSAYRSYGLIEYLADTISNGRGWTVARRLRQVVDEMRLSPDGHVHMVMDTPQPGMLDVTAWYWGNHQDGHLPWWFHADLEVTVGPRGRTRIQPISPVLLATRDWDRGAITYKDSPDGPLGHLIASWLISWTGRLGIQGCAGLVDEDAGEDLPELVTCEEFTGRFSPSTTGPADAR